MDEKYWYLIVGVVIGWVLKIPFLIKWYRELRRTRSYERMKDLIHVKELEERYAELYPDRPFNIYKWTK